MTARCKRPKACFDGLCHRPLGFERHQLRHAQFHGLFDEPLLPIALGKRHAQRDRKRKFAVDFLAGENFQIDLAAADFFDRGRKFRSAAVEKHDPNRPV